MDAQKKKKTKEPVVDAKVDKEFDSTKYLLIVTVNNVDYKFNTLDIADSISSIKPGFIKTKVVLKITRGDKSCEKIFFGFQARQLFISPTFRRIVISKLVFK